MSDTDFEMDVPAEPASVGAVRDALTAWAALPDENRRRDLAIATSELVTNAVLHGPPNATITVRARRAPTALAVEVCDEGCVGLAPRQRVPDTSGGRGLHIVERVSTAWGIRGDPTCVWFRLTTG